MRGKPAFTLVELLVVVTIIGILIAMLLPAVQAAREAARRIQCGNNFKQVGVAMHDYHAAIGVFPPGTITWQGLPATGCTASPDGSATYIGWGWGTFILPYLDQQPLYDRFDFRGRSGTYDALGNPNSTTLPGRNMPLGETRLPVYMCPTDPQAGELCQCTMTTYSGHTSNPLEDWAMSNMAGVCDSARTLCNSIQQKQGKESDGVLGGVQSCSLEQIEDGASNTLLIGEVTGGGRGTHYGFYWVTLGVNDTGQGINGPGTIPGKGTFALYSMKGGFSSYHPGGCHFVQADGSVRFLSATIDATALKSLTTRAGHEAISNGAL